jgi:hypothetical protein
MSQFEEQFPALQEEFPAATYAKAQDGSYLVTIPDFALPQGWSAENVTLRFIAPVGYPHSKPDCFWCDPDLKLAGGGVPQASGFNQMPNGPAPLLWFSWHMSVWSPNADTLLTYVHVIEKRFMERR